MQTTFTFRHKYLSFLSLSCNFQGSTTPTELFPMGVCLSINWDCFSHDKYTPGTLSYNSIWIRTVWSCSDFGNYKHEREKSLLTCEEMNGHQGRLNMKWFYWISNLQIEKKTVTRFGIMSLVWRMTSWTGFLRDHNTIGNIFSLHSQNAHCTLLIWRKSLKTLSEMPPKIFVC